MTNQITYKISLSPAVKDKIDERMVTEEIVKRAYSCARDHVTDRVSVASLADDIQFLMLWAWRKGGDRP